MAFFTTKRKERNESVGLEESFILAAEKFAEEGRPMVYLTVKRKAESEITKVAGQLITGLAVHPDHEKVLAAGVIPLSKFPARTPTVISGTLFEEFIYDYIDDNRDVNLGIAVFPKEVKITQVRLKDENGEFVIKGVSEDGTVEYEMVPNLHVVLEDAMFSTFSAILNEASLANFGGEEGIEAKLQLLSQSLVKQANKAIDQNRAMRLAESKGEATVAVPQSRRRRTAAK